MSTKANQNSSLQLMTELESISGPNLAMEIITNFKNSIGVDLERIFLDGNLSTNQKIKRGQHELIKGLLNRLNVEKNEETSGDNIDGLLYALATDTEVEPNISFVPSDLPFILSYDGEEVLTYLKTLTKRFENMSNAKTSGQLAIELVSSGLIGLGIPATFAAVKALKAGKTIKQAALAGVKGIGLKTAITVVAIILVVLLLFFFFENPKKVLGMIINQTTNNLVVTDWEKGTDGDEDGNLYMESGEMLNFMQDQVSLASHKYQIKAGEFIEDEDEKVVFGGIYFADKNTGVYGAEGVMVFSTPDSSLQFAHMFASPYHADNGTNMTLISGKIPDLSELYDSLYESRAVNVRIEDSGCIMQSRANNSTGGVVGCIASIETKFS